MSKSFYSQIVCACIAALIPCLSVQAAEVLDQNILVNGDFSSANGGWSVGNGGFGRENNNPQRPGGGYFYSSGSDKTSCWIYQEFDLVAMGYDEGRLATGGYGATFSGLQNSRYRVDANPAWMGNNDAGTISLIEKDDNGQLYTTELPTVIGSGTNDGWIWQSDSVRLSEGLTRLRYRFDAVQVVPSGNNTAFLADAYLSLTAYDIWTSGDNSKSRAKVGDWTTTNLTLIGDTGNGQINVTNDATWTSTSFTRIGENPNSRGTVNLDGGHWTATDYTYVGWKGTGIVNIQDGSTWTTSGLNNGMAVAAGSVANVNIEQGGTWLAGSGFDIGESGTATINIGSGGLWQTGGLIDLGIHSNGQGIVNVDGGTWRANGDVRLGYAGQGVVNVRDGGLWETKGNVHLGGQFDGDGIVNVSGGLWDSRGHTSIGHYTPGEVHVTGGEMSVKNNPLSILSGSTLEIDGGTVTLHDGLNNNGTLDFRSGELRILGGNVNKLPSYCGGLLELGAGTGTTTLDTMTAINLRLDDAKIVVGNGGMLNIIDTLELVNGGIVKLDNANLVHTQNRLLLSDARITGHGEVFVGSSGINLGTADSMGSILGSSASERLTIYGDVSGTGTLEHVTVFGNIDVGNSPGTINAADLTLSSNSQLTMELGGLLAGTEYDQIVADGLLTLDGKLLVEWYDGFEAELGDSFTLFSLGDSGSLAGQFSSISLPGFSDASLYWNTSDLYATGALTIVPEPATITLLAGVALLGLRKRRQ